MEMSVGGVANHEAPPTDAVIPEDPLLAETHYSQASSLECVCVCVCVFLMCVCLSVCVCVCVYVIT